MKFNLMVYTRNKDEFYVACVRTSSFTPFCHPVQSFFVDRACKPKCPSLNFGYRNVMRTATIEHCFWGGGHTLLFIQETKCILSPDTHTSRLEACEQIRSCHKLVIAH